MLLLLYFADESYTSGATILTNDPLYWASLDLVVTSDDRTEVIEFVSSHYDVYVEVVGVDPASDIHVEMSGLKPCTSLDTNEAFGDAVSYYPEVVSIGEIKLSTNSEQILYFEKCFSISNKSIEGSITYGATASSQRAMPKDSFVVLQRVSDGARVGSFTIDSDGHYLLRLRNEYEINWDLDEYKVDFTNSAESGKVYATENAITLPNLMANPNITLILSE